MKINGFAAFGPRMKLEKFSYEKDIGENDVLVSVKYTTCTLGDTRFIDNFWGDTHYPLIPGAEIIGVIEETGKNVKSLRKGDAVGLGYQVGACFYCEYCLAGKEQFCQQQKLICLGEYGGFADSIIVDYRFVFKLSKNLVDPYVTPLMCSGLTVFSGIRKGSVRKGMKVGVIGVGNLGHLALQFLHKMGCSVTAFSHSEEKRDLMKKLGASETVDSISTSALHKIERQYDFLISTSSGPLDWSLYIKTLKPEGILCFVGLPPKEISFKAELLADYAQRSIIGNYVGSRKNMIDMLDFLSKNPVKAIGQVFNMEQVNDVVEKTRQNAISFSAILSN
ncbi:NAD(P)-dependent alcohol dehydrogenase [Candidatus Gottesmanbacteria bacterium]|nr:NAD(P)-dependent alcohol dehydrogenase [Candidatus Gottesmanbacteria bacterium]